MIPPGLSTLCAERGCPDAVGVIGPALWQALSTVVRAVLLVRWRSLYNTFARTSGPERRRAWSLPVYAAVVMLVVGWVTYRLFAVLFGPEAIRHSFVLADRLPAFILLWVFWMLVLSGISVAIQQLYADRETTLLLATPMPGRTVFIAKFMDMTAANGVLFLLTGGPTVATYALVRGYLTLEYIIRCSVALLAFCALATALGALCAILLMRFLPAGRLREVMGALALTGLSVAYIALNAGARRLQNPDSAEEGLQAITAAVSGHSVSVGPWAWAGTVLGTPTGYPEAYVPAFLLLLTAALSIAIGAVVTDHLHWRGWYTAQESPTYNGRGSRQLRAERLFSWLPSSVRAFTIKDTRTLARDMRQLSMLLLPVAVVIVFLINLRAVPESATAPQGLVSMSLLPLIGLIVFRIALSAYIGEGSALWLALASPATAHSMLLGKLWYTFLISLPFAIVSMAAYAYLYALTTFDLTVAMLVTIVATFAMAGIGVGVGGRCIVISPQDGRVALPGTWRMLTYGLQILYAAVVAGFMALGWLVSSAARIPPFVAYGVALSGVAAVSVVGGYMPIAVAARRIRSLEM